MAKRRSIPELLDALIDGGVVLKRLAKRAGLVPQTFGNWKAKPDAEHHRDSPDPAALDKVVAALDELDADVRAIRNEFASHARSLRRSGPGNGRKGGARGH